MGVAVVVAIMLATVVMDVRLPLCMLPMRGVDVRVSIGCWRFWGNCLDHLCGPSTCETCLDGLDHKPGTDRHDEPGACCFEPAGNACHVTADQSKKGCEDGDQSDCCDALGSR